MERARAEGRAMAVDSEQDLKQVLETGLSGVPPRPLYLQILLLPPKTTFKLHSHPTFEICHCLRGGLGEISTHLSVENLQGFCEINSHPSLP